MRCRTVLTVAVAAIAGLLCPKTLPAESGDWLAFRGDGRSFAPSAKTPATFDVESGENIAWNSRTSGRGISGPLVIGDHVIVTGCSGEDERDLHVESFSVESGKRQWSRTMRATGRPFTHPTSSNASPTPASDGERVFALFSSCDLICCRVDGTLLWYRALALDHPKTGNDISMSSSPVVADGVVMVQLENQGDSFAMGLDTQTGETLWTLDRDASSNWSTPQPIQLDEDNAGFAFNNRSSIDIVDAKTGTVAQHFDIGGDGTASIAYSDPYILVPGQNTTAIRLGSQTAPGKDIAEIAWESNKLRPQRCSPVVSNDRVYMGKGSVLMAGALSDGSVLWQARLGKLGNVWATPVLTATGLYVVDSDGRCIVVADRGDKGEVIGKSELGEKVLASPAVSGDALFLRTEFGVIKVSES